MLLQEQAEHSPSLILQFNMADFYTPIVFATGDLCGICRRLSITCSDLEPHDFWMFYYWHNYDTSANIPRTIALGWNPTTSLWEAYFTLTSSHGDPYMTADIIITVKNDKSDLTVTANGASLTIIGTTTYSW